MSIAPLLLQDAFDFLALGTGLLVAGRLESAQWLYLGLAYIAGDSAEKAMAAISKK